MASVRKKYNPVAKAQKHKAQLLKMADLKIRRAIKGVTVAYNSSWGQDEQFYPAGMERIIALLKGDLITACGVVVEISTRWRIYITINCESQDGEQYAYLLPVIDKVGQMQHLEDEIEKIVIPKALKDRNQAHVKDWGYWGEIV